MKEASQVPKTENASSLGTKIKISMSASFNAKSKSMSSCENKYDSKPSETVEKNKAEVSNIVHSMTEKTKTNHPTVIDPSQKIEINKRAINQIIGMLGTIQPDQITSETKDDLVRIHILLRGIQMRSNRSGEVITQEWLKESPSKATSVKVPLKTAEDGLATAPKVVSNQLTFQSFSTLPITDEERTEFAEIVPRIFKKAEKGTKSQNGN